MFLPQTVITTVTEELLSSLPFWEEMEESLKNDTKSSSN